MDKFIAPWAHDKELMRALPPRFVLDSYQQVGFGGGLYHDLGQGAWLADLDALLVINSDLRAIIDTYVSQPSIIVQSISPAFNRIRVLYVPRGFSGNEPCSLNHIDTAYATSTHKNLLSSELLIVIIESDAQISFFEGYESQGFRVRSIAGSLGARSQVSFMSDYRYGHDAYGIEHELWHVEADAQFSRITALTGGVQSYHFQEYALGQRASLEQVALSALRGKEQAALVTKQKHVGDGCRSSVLVKAALSDESCSFYRGTIAIAEQARLSEAHQQQRALMLSSKARACAIPSLEVATHDVRCSHGSAAGRFNAEEMGYLCARGLDRASAEKLLIRAFFNDQALEKYSDLTAHLLAKLQV